jgi:hypothetical protein
MFTSSVLQPLIREHTDYRVSMDMTKEQTEELKMELEPGQQVVWIYQPHVTGRLIHLVDAEIVHMGRLRARIRVMTATGEPLLRWVKPCNLRHKASDEPAYPYPEGYL